MNTSKNTIKQGFIYALYVYLGAIIMGAIYGMFGLIFIGPSIFAASLVGIVVILNFPIAFVIWVINVILHMFTKHSNVVYRYFKYSFAFFVLFMVHFSIIKFFDVKVF